MSALADHRIARVVIGTLRDRYPRTIGCNARLGSHGSGGTFEVVVIRTNAGAMGWGILAGDVKPIRQLVGMRVSDVFDPDVGVIDERAIALDFALHDLAGQILGKPVFRLLGGAGPTAVPCYDGAIYLDDLTAKNPARGIEKVLANCKSDRALGYRSFKLKIGRGHRWLPAQEGLRRDIEVTRAVRAAFPDARIMVDANDGYTTGEFLTYLEAVADCELFWVEEPFRETRPYLRRLRRFLDRLGTGTLVADGERDPDVPFLLALAADGLLDVLIMDIVSYGFTAWRRIMPVLREVGAQASPHAWGRPLKTIYAAHLAAGLGNVVAVEGVPGRIKGVRSDNYRLIDGKLHLSEAPGFGLPVPSISGAIP
ncbi:MAG TPA: enolase C-terminal domain-like protein [Actinopolymorphaceae bacterium]|jgi:L-alanine-DL-glutamate epimerase-like enolase superfamily enzyme